jgi:mono/diheme cytochrome c family protein
MAATSRLGVLLLVAACGGGNGAGRTDTTAVASIPPAEQPTTGSATADTGMAATGAAPAESASMAPAAAPAAAPSPTTAKKASGAAQDTSKKKAAAKPAAKPAAGGAGGAQSPQQVALGDSIFHGQVAGGTCTACHGQDAKGTAVAPNLTDAQWINGDGSYDFIVKTVTNGVPQPKEHPAPMPPKGGAQLSDDQVKAVAAYVFSLSHKS